MLGRCASRGAGASLVISRSALAHAPSSFGSHTKAKLVSDIQGLTEFPGNMAIIADSKLV
jgi:hypothetical protein